jgi:hypothetical protein
MAFAVPIFSEGFEYTLTILKEGAGGVYSAERENQIA